MNPIKEYVVPEWKIPLIEGEELIKSGTWYIYRDLGGELKHVVLPDITVGSFSQEEMKKLLEAVRPELKS